MTQATDAAELRNTNMQNAQVKIQHEPDETRPAPKGRVIRRAATREDLKLVSANSDRHLIRSQTPSKDTKQQQDRILFLSLLGIFCGVILSLLSTERGIDITKMIYSEKIFRELESNLIAVLGGDNITTKDTAPAIKAAASRRRELELAKFIPQPPNQAKAPSLIQNSKNRAAYANKAPIIQLPSNNRANPAKSQRLASFYIDPHYISPLRAIRRDLEQPQHAPTATRVRVVNANYQAEPRKVEVIQHNPKAALSKVYAIIKKHSPKHQAPGQLAHAIVNESIRQGVDPLFVAAVIKSESAFNPRARSHKGAQGLMQIMPATGAWLARQQNIPHGRLSDPGHNLRLGISYLKYLEENFKGDRIFALVAYNWGPGHLDSASGGRRRIPRECMTYALKIINDYKRWHSGVI